MSAAIKLTRGVAGQVEVSAVSPDGRVSFVGNRYGGPVVMVLPSGTQSFVSDPGRFGDFSADPVEWVRRFVAA